MNITSIAQMRDEFRLRASIAGVQVDCMMDGVFNSEIAIVAEAPGEHEVARNTPLIGASGSYLWANLRKYNVTRLNTYVTNVVKRQLSLGEKGRAAISKHEVETWKGMLLWELDQLPNVKYVLALGNYALSALTGSSGITSWRGSVLTVELPSTRKVQVLCTFNPAMILREPKTEISFIFDLGKLSRVLNGTYKTKEISAKINPSYKEAIEFIEHIHGEAISSNTPIAYDYEVISLETACIGFANSSTSGMCINFRNMTQDIYTVVEEREIRKRIQFLYSDKRVRFIAQNGMFDMTWAWFKDAMVPHANWFDTMLAHHTLYPTLPHNLGYITTQYTDHPYYKDEKDDWREGGNIDQFWQYNVKDCCNTFEAAYKMLDELRDQNMDKFFFSHVMKLQPHLARMTVGGIKIDMSLKEKIRDELTETLATKLASFQASVQSATNDSEYVVNPRSPSQLGELFFKRLKLVGRGGSTDAANRDRIRKHPRTNEAAKDVLNKLDDYLKDAKFLSTYAEMEVDKDGRARCEYKQTGVQSAPGRLSSSKTMWGSGMNLQNQPSRAQPMFVADTGFGFGYFDMAQAEARIVAWDARITLWKEQFERARRDGSYDAHRALAAEMFRIPYDDVPTSDEDEHGNKTLRFISKRCRHGLNYRMQPDRLAQTTGLPISQAVDAFNRYHSATPELRRWWAEKEAEVKRTKMLFNAYGRRLFLLERLTDEALESIVAFYPQSTLGDHVSRTMILCEEDDQWPTWARLVLNVHDALIAIAPLDKIKTCLAIMKRHAEAPIMIKGEPLIIPADLKMSVADEQGIHRWSTLAKVKL